MTRKTARKTAARARQEKTGGSYQAALRAGEPKAPDYAKRVREAFMVLNNGLHFTGHLAPTREQLMGRIQQALQILAPPEDAVMQSLRHHRFPFDVTDIHTTTAAMLGVTREGAKEINAAFLYGSSGMAPPGYVITESRDIETEYELDGSIRDMKPVPGSERVTITRMPFRVEEPAQLRVLASAKRCTAPKLRLLGVTDGTTVRWTTLTKSKEAHGFTAWWLSLPEAEPYSRTENDER